MAKFNTKSVRFIVPVDIYNRDLYVSLGESDERFGEGLRRYKPDEWVDEAVRELSFGITGLGRMGSKDGFFILRLKNFPEDSSHFGTLQHEIFHYVEAMFAQAGMPHSLKYSSEAYAYLIGYLTQQIYDRIWT